MFKESRLRHVQQRSPFASFALFVHEPIDRDYVFGRASAFKSCSAHHGWHAPGMARWATHTGAGFHFANWNTVSGHRSGGHRHHRTGNDRENTQRKGGAPSVWERNPESITQNSHEFY